MSTGIHGQHIAWVNGTIIADLPTDSVAVRMYLALRAQSQKDLADPLLDVTMVSRSDLAAMAGCPDRSNAKRALDSLVRSGVVQIDPATRGRVLCLRTRSLKSERANRDKDRFVKVSWQTVMQVRDARRLKVLMALMRHGTAQGRVSAAAATIAGSAGLSVRATYRALTHLRRLGLVQVLDTVMAPGATFPSHVYRVDVARVRGDIIGSISKPHDPPPPNDTPVFSSDCHLAADGTATTEPTGVTKPAPIDEVAVVCDHWVAVRRQVLGSAARNIHATPRSRHAVARLLEGDIDAGQAFTAAQLCDLLHFASRHRYWASHVIDLTGLLRHAPRMWVDGDYVSWSKDNGRPSAHRPDHIAERQQTFGKLLADTDTDLSAWESGW